MTVMEIAPVAGNRGHAEIRLPEGSLLDSMASLKVGKPASSQKLGRDAAGVVKWGNVAEEFGPFDVRTITDGRRAVVIGPDITTAFDVFDMLDIELAGQTAQVSWPDNIDKVRPRTGGGRIAGAQSQPAAAKPAPRAAAPAAPKVEPKPTAQAVSAAPEETPSAEPASRPRWLWWALGTSALLLMIGAGLAVSAPYWTPYVEDLWPTIDPETVPTPSSEGPVACSELAAERAADDPRGAIETALEHSASGGCDGALDAPAALRLLRDAADAGSGEALAVFGGLYDPNMRDPLFNDRLALTLSDDASLALDYYDRARAAGAEGVDAAIGELCATIADSTDPLTVEAAREYCA